MGDMTKHKIAPLKPAGSLEPMNATSDKWNNGIDAQGLETLSLLAVDINRSLNEADQAIGRCFIKVGKLLTEARAIIPGDRQFGQWRSENTMVQSSGTARALMNVSKVVDNYPNMKEKLGWSVINELLRGGQPVLDKIEAKLEAGEKPPTKEEARNLASSPRGAEPDPLPLPVPHPARGTDTPLRASGVVSRPTSPVAEWQLERKETRRLVQDDFRHRATWIEKISPPKRDTRSSYVLFGLDPDPSIPINKSTLYIIKMGLLDECHDDEDKDAVITAYDKIVDDIEHFDDGV